jgi:hypothetical protein
MFWNQSIKHAYTLDSTYPGPGPTVTPGLAKPDGSLTDDPARRTCSPTTA